MPERESRDVAVDVQAVPDILGRKGAKSRKTIFHQNVEIKKRKQLLNLFKAISHEFLLLYKKISFTILLHRIGTITALTSGIGIRENCGYDKSGDEAAQDAPDCETAETEKESCSGSWIFYCMSVHRDRSGSMGKFEKE